MKYYAYVILILLLATSCKEYKIENNKVYIAGWNEGNGSYQTLVENADANTFQTIDSGDDNSLFGKDKNHVYDEWRIIDNCDPKTIKYLGNYYYTTKDSVYFFGFYNDVNDCEIVGANPKTINVTGQYPWAYDDKHIIYGHDIIEANDISSFVPLSETWAKSDARVFYKGKPLRNADAATFTVIDDENGRDKNRHYHRSRY